MSALIIAQDEFFLTLLAFRQEVKALHPLWRLTPAELGVQVRRTVVRDGQTFQAIDRVHRPKSLHYERLAIDWNLFVPQAGTDKLFHVTRSDAPEWDEIRRIAVKHGLKVMPSASSDANHVSKPLPGDPRI